MPVAVKVGISWLGESIAPHAHWVENPGDSAVFVDAAAATAYAAARNVTFVYEEPIVSGKRVTSKKTNND